MTVALTTTILLFLLSSNDVHLVTAYDQHEESSYLANFPTLASSSHSELNSNSSSWKNDVQKNWILENCAENGKIIEPLEEVIVNATNLISTTVTSDQVQAQCGEHVHCIVPEPLVLVMTGNLNVGALTLHGSQLIWNDGDAGLDGIHYSLCTGFLLAKNSMSLFEMKLYNPESTGVIYMKNNGANAGGMLGTRVFGTDEGGSMIMEGSTNLKRTWTLLKQDFGVGDSEMSVIHNVVEMGWKIGDRIGIAPTVHGSTGTGQTFIITAITGHTIQLSHANPLHNQVHEASFIHGGKEGEAPPILKAAEVIHLSRNILITGDDFDHIPCDPSILSNEETSAMGCKCSNTRTHCTIGLHTIHHSDVTADNNSGSAVVGTMKISGTRVEKCGQRGIEGKYCLHFHLAGDCPNCLFENNAVEYGHHRGITVHGTHRSTVTNNVIWDVRGANVYIEDGNEMYNEISYNVAICPHSLSDPVLQGCSIPGTSNAGSDAPNAAFYSKSITNDWTGNRAGNTYNGMLVDAGTRGKASGKVCSGDGVMGRWVGNTAHGCSRFGLYTLGHGGNFPKVTDRSIATNGLNQNFELCEGFDAAESIIPGTTDRGHPAAFYQNVDYHNVFVGHYMAGDLQHRAHSSINNNNLIYWKETKNFADGCSSHFYDSFYQDGNLALPDQSTVIMSRTRFGKNVHLEFNHHCDVGSTGVLCMPQYILDDIVWENDSPNKWISFQAGYNSNGGVISAAPGQEEAPNGFFPQGYHSIAGSIYTYLLSSPGPRKCIDSTPTYGNRYDNGILCNAPLRSFKIYSRGLTEATAPMLKVEVYFNSLGLLGQNGPANVEQLVGFHIIGDSNSNSVKQGYSFPIMAGTTQSYRISLYDPNESSTAEIPFDWVIEFSDPVIGNRFGEDDVVVVNVLGRSCGANGNGVITSQHDRRFLWSGDHFIDDVAWGYHGACTDGADMMPVDCAALVGGGSNEGSIEASECPELCAASPCNPENSYCRCGMPSTCKCKPGFTGADCSENVCALANCGNHGSCVATYLGGSSDVTIDASVACICETGWFGEKCEFNPCEVGESFLTCSGNGKCVSLDGINTQCHCEMGYLGDNCEVLNVAHGKVSLSTSEIQPSSRAFDGNLGSRWESAHGVNDVFLQVDLGDVYNVERVDIIWETSAAKRYDIELSVDGASFLSVWSEADGQAGMVRSNLSGASGRFVRMHAFERVTGYGYSIFEMQVFGTMGATSPPTPWPTFHAITLSPTISKVPTSNPTTLQPTFHIIELASGKTSSSSSEIAAASTSKAFDGDQGSRWESAHGVEDVWLQVDLGEIFRMSKVVIYWEYACAKEYDIEVSNDGVLFTTVWSKTDGYGGMGVIESTNLGGASGRFVRMHAFKRATVWGYSIFEMQVFGYASRSPMALSDRPTLDPAHALTFGPTNQPTSNPTLVPTHSPTNSPTNIPTNAPNPLPSSIPTRAPTPTPTVLQNPPPTPPLPTLNIAKGHASTSSSENWAGSAAIKAFDGDFGSRYESQHGIENVFLQVDLETEYTLDMVKISWEYSCAKEYDIQVSNDGISFTTVWSKTDGFPGMGVIKSDISGVSGRYVRMQAYKRATGWGYSLWEMEVFGTMLPTATPVRLPTGDVSASSEIQSSSRAFDANPGSRWESAHGVEDVWLQVDLGNVYEIDRVIIDWEYSCAKEYDIEVSNDGVLFTTVWSKTDGYGGMGVIESTNLGGASGRFVRMHAFKRATVWGYSIFEMQVFGSA